MGSPRLSSGQMRALLGAAKADGPSAATRSKIWGKVSSSVGAASAAGASGAGAAKLLATGTLFGGMLTVGVAAAVLFLRATPGQAAGAAITSTTASVAMPATALMVTPATALMVTPATSDLARADTSSAKPGLPAVPSVPARVRPDQDPLAREASLVADARAALARNAPQAALRIVRATRTIAPRQLIPEELSIQAQALRVLGRTQEADAIEGVLRSRYPESAFAR
jgi:hypothetical protein